MEEIKLNSHYVNAKIQGHILSDDKMKEIGFTEYRKGYLYFCRGIQFPKEKRYRGLDISFSVTIPRDGTDIRIDVLDEDFCQPYDYQMILSKSPNHTCANIVNEQVVWTKVTRLVRHNNNRPMRFIKFANARKRSNKHLRVRNGAIFI